METEIPATLGRGNSKNGAEPLRAESGPPRVRRVTSVVATIADWLDKSRRIAFVNDFAILRQQDKAITGDVTVTRSVFGLRDQGPSASRCRL